MLKQTLQSTTVDQWNYIDSVKNAADRETDGISYLELKETDWL